MLIMYDDKKGFHAVGQDVMNMEDHKQAINGEAKNRAIEKLDEIISNINTNDSNVEDKEAVPGFGGTGTGKTSQMIKAIAMDELEEKINEFKKRANRPNAWDLDVKKLLRDCNWDVDLAVSLILDPPIKEYRRLGVDR